MINILFEGRFIYNYDNYKMVIFVLLYFFFSGRVNVKCLVDNVVFKCNDEVCIYFLSYIVICIFVMMRYLGGGGWRV